MCSQLILVYLLYIKTILILNFSENHHSISFLCESHGIKLSLALAQSGLFFLALHIRIRLLFIHLIFAFRNFHHSKFLLHHILCANLS